jgi:hypothetical protein
MILKHQKHITSKQKKKKFKFFEKCFPTAMPNALIYGENLPSLIARTTTLCILVFEKL